jgi:hypothetical protein
MPKQWYNNPWIWAGLGVVVVGGFVLLPDARFAVSDIIVRGNKVTDATWFNDDEAYGFIIDEPEALAAQASFSLGVTIDVDTYSLARMIRSEGARQGLVRAHVAMNDLKTFAYASSLTGLLTYSTDPDRKGYYGKQYSGPMAADTVNSIQGFPNANKRRYSTAADPYDSDVQTAQIAIAERATGVDRVDGATKFIDKSSMGVQVGSKSFDAIDAQWQADGLVPFTLAGVGTDLVFYKKG